jgi:hypothetical protein
MSTKLEQEAADTLQAHEERTKFRKAECARWAKAQPVPIVGTWAPTMTERQKQEHDRYVAENNLPF